MDTLPIGFNCDHYIMLNHYSNVPLDKKLAIEHYKNYGAVVDLSYNIDNIKIVIYSAGKTGTTTLHESFYKLIPYREIFSIHSDTQFKTNNTVSNIINYKRTHKLLVISSYREPISRTISCFFQCIEQVTFLSIKEILKVNTNYITEKLLEYMDMDQFYLPFEENNGKNLDNINIFDKEFDKSNGYQIFETSNAKFLILKFDTMDKWENIIKNNTEYKEFKLYSANLTEEKPINNLYKKIKKELIIPKHVLDKYYEKEEKFINYFYTPNEINNIKNNWYNKLLNIY